MAAEKTAWPKRPMSSEQSKSSCLTTVWESFAAMVTGYGELSPAS
jgi:hypothetical protein